MGQTLHVWREIGADITLWAVNKRQTLLLARNNRKTTNFAVEERIRNLFLSEI